MNESAKTNDALDMIIDMVFAERIFNTSLETTQEQKDELRFAILLKLNEMGVRLVEIDNIIV